MPREYKLRLGDGTVLAVDEQGLRTWALDGKAMVQAAGSSHWRPLKEVLAEVAASAPRSGSASRRGPRLDDGIPIIPLKPLDDGRSPRRAAAVRATSLVGAISGWVARLTRRASPASSPAELELAGAGSARRDPLQPPPPLSALPTVRLARVEEEEREDEELYEGDAGDSVFAVAWLWMKRLALIAGLAAGGVLAVKTWPTWLPVVTQVCVVIFTKVDEYVHPERARVPGMKDETQRQMQEALQQATGQLPYLSRETIQLVMSSNMWSVLDPPEVFSRAYAAAKRGSPALAPQEAEELKTLETALLARLGPSERQRVREYDRVRLQRATLPAEDREMLGLFARAARALPAQSRGRLQALFGKAIAAGLASRGASMDGVFLPLTSG